ncbi:lytic murein transglycosylase B [Gammaproteobacteria bacterium]|jgi:membrane-bound lytic murein transglycosylase B|nr:lytic murein transglycosylase B [Gammaproteobacteria bacterium]MDC1147458.1 lytic murein transglycosylase B [Gammaproteobacteria bacterium]
MKLLFILFVLFSNSMLADYSEHPEAKDVIKTLVSEHGFDESYVIKILQTAKKQEQILKSMSSPAEFTWTWDRYKKLFLEEKRISNGKKFIKENSDLFIKVEREFGVPKEIITSILGVETRYGKIKGSYRVLDSLVTLGFDFPRRSKFFKSELIQFFILTRENNLDINAVQGSYAGAMGYGQFISSSYRAYAIDYDGDGYADLFNSVPDAVASIANYLQKHGWKRDGAIVQKVEINKVNKTYKHQANLKKYIPLQFTEGLEEEYIIKNGDSLSSIAISNNLELQQLMTLNNIKNKNLIKSGQTILLNKPQDLYFIGDDNFIAITKYNRSHFYAKAVYDLSLEFKQ